MVIGIILLVVHGMKLRVFSDLHIDINKNNYYIPPDDNILNIIAGDVSGDPYITCNYLLHKVNKALFVHGNHIVYNDNNKALQELEDDLFEQLAHTSVIYLNNNYAIIDDIVFIGSTLYTDYKYKFTETINARIAMRGLNDFKWGRYLNGNILEHLTPYHYMEMHANSMMYIQQKLEQFHDKKCVVITHHGISPQAICKKYKNSDINASFISDHEKFVKSYPNIKVWIFGHIHNSFDFKINDTRIIGNPYGYGNENPDFNKNLIIEV